MEDDSVRAARSDRRARLLVSIGAALVVFVGGEVLLRDHVRALHAWADLSWTFVAGFAAWRCWKTAAARPRAHQRSAWRWIAAGCASWTFGMLVWDIHELVWGVVTPFPTLADVGYHATPLCFAIGLSFLRGDAPSRQLTLKQMGDLGVVISAIAISATIVLYAPAADNDESVLYIVAALAYPVIGLGSFAFGLTTLWQLPAGRRRRIVAVLVGATAVLGTVTSFYAVSLLTETYEAGDELDVFWILAFAIVIWASSEEAWHEEEDEEVEVERIVAGDILLPPFVVLTVAVSFVVFRDRLRPELEIPLATIAGVLAMFGCAREWGMHRIERALRSAARRDAGLQRRLNDMIPLGIAEIDAGGRVIASNARFETMVDARSRDLVDPTWRDVGLAPLVARALATREPVLSDEPLAIGEARFRCAISPVGDRDAGALVVIEDVTQELRLQRDFLQSQKMQAVGTLAGGIAHDFNNLLSGMIASVTLLKRRSLGESDSAVFLDHMEQSMWRAAELTQRLLAVSRRRDPVKTAVDVRALVERVVALLARSVDETIAVRAELPSEPIALHGDAGQLEQALLNLGINARDAMRPKGGDLRFQLTREGDASGRRVVIRVRDTGGGIAPELRSRIFEPFFTTKEVGEGTGLGLAMVYAFVRDHGGTIEVDSELGRGTTFTMRLPASDLELSAPREPRSTEIPRGHETVLVVDDRDTALFAMKAILSDLGYTVVVAGNGVEALAELERRRGAIDLVVTDAMMRRMGGRDLLSSLRGRDVVVPVILATGLEAESHRGDDGFAAVLRKPFDPSETARVVRDVLDAARRDHAAAVATGAGSA